MPEWFLNMSPVLQAVLATCCTWGATTMGAALIFGFKYVNKTLFDALMSGAAGIMLAASVFSLLLPALGMAHPICVCAAFLLGGVFMLCCDRLLERRICRNDARRRQVMLIASITLHNIPEGFVIGVMFGSLGIAAQKESIAGAMALTAGIACQNLPEGFAVSAPLLREGTSKRKAFFMGQLSGMVEIAAGLTGAVLVQMVSTLLPWMLSIAAGAMVYVVTAELIPESMKNGVKRMMTFCCMAGFAVMMLLDTIMG